MKPDERVFKLSPPAISMKIKNFARKAGLENFHAHTLRHKFATDLLERGANIKVVQELMGHESLNTTEVYLSVTEKTKRDAIHLLDEPAEKSPEGGKAKQQSLRATPHEQKMRRLAIELAGRIRFPSLHDTNLMDWAPLGFEDGEHQIPLGDVSISRGNIRVSYRDPSSGMAAPHLIEGLFSHLSTSGSPELAGLLGESGMISNWTTEAGRCSEALLRLLEMMLAEAGKHKARH